MTDVSYSAQDNPATEPVCLSWRRYHGSLEARLIANSFVDPVTECWLGKRAKRRGGAFDGRLNLWIRGRSVMRRAHRVSYEEFRGPIPEGFEVDHTCCNTLCINPAHLEAVPGSVNLARRDQRRKA